MQLLLTLKKWLGLLTIDGLTQICARHRKTSGKCQNIVLANSTFSWWGAYLSDASVVLCPSRFINDDRSGEIYLGNWIRVN